MPKSKSKAFEAGENKPFRKGSYLRDLVNIFVTLLGHIRWSRVKKSQPSEDNLSRNIYYVRGLANIFFLNKDEDEDEEERWVNVLQIGEDNHYALNDWNSAHIIKLYEVDQLAWGDDVLDGRKKKKVHVFQSLVNGNMFAVFGDDLSLLRDLPGEPV